MIHILKNVVVVDTPIAMRTHAYKRDEKRLLATTAALIAAGIGAASAAASTAIGGAQSSRANKRARERAWATKAEEMAQLRRQRDEDYADTAAGQNIIRQAREIADRSTRQVRGSQAVGGGTDSAVAVAKESANKTVSDTMSNIAANDTSRKDRASDNIRNTERHYGDLEFNLEQQRANNIATAASGLSNAVMQGGALVANAYGDQTKNSVVGTNTVTN